MPIQLAASVTCVRVMTARELLLQEKEIAKVSTASGAALQAYVAECGVSVWLERSATKLADRVRDLEHQLRVASPQDHDRLEDALRTSRTNLALVWRGLGRSPGLARRLAAQSEQDAEQLHLRLVGLG